MTTTATRTLLASAVLAAVGLSFTVDAWAQGARAAAAERRAARNAQAAQQAEQEQTVKYPHATRNAPKGAASPRIAPKLNQLSDAYNQGDYQRAVSLADEVLAEGRANDYERAIAARIGGAALIGEDPTRAISYFERAVGYNALNNNDHFDSIYTIAQLQAQEEQYAQALATLEQLQRDINDPNNADMLALRGNMLYRMERYPEALQALQAAVESNPSADDSVMQLLMATYSELNQTEQAVQLAERIAQADPSDVRKQMNLANIYLQAEQQTKALEVLQRLRSGGQLTEANQYRNLYVILMNADGQEQQVIEVVNEGLQKGILQENHEVHNVLAQAYYFSGQVAQAISAWQKAAPLANDGQTYMNLARALNNEGRAAEARAAAESAIAKGLPDESEARSIIQRGSR